MELGKAGYRESELRPNAFAKCCVILKRGRNQGGPWEGGTLLVRPLLSRPEPPSTASLQTGLRLRR